MIYIQSFFIWLYTKSPLICYNRNRVNGLEHCESSILYREGFILCYPSNLIAGRTLEQFGEKIIRSAKILHIRVGFSFIVLPHPGSCTAGARYTRRKEVTL